MWVLPPDVALSRVVCAGGQCLAVCVVDRSSAPHPTCFCRRQPRRACPVRHPRSAPARQRDATPSEQWLELGIEERGALAAQKSAANSGGGGGGGTASSWGRAGLDLRAGQNLLMWRSRDYRAKPVSSSSGTRLAMPSLPSGASLKFERIEAGEAEIIERIEVCEAEIIRRIESQVRAERGGRRSRGQRPKLVKFELKSLTHTFIKTSRDFSDQVSQR